MTPLLEIHFTADTNFTAICDGAVTFRHKSLTDSDVMGQFCLYSLLSDVAFTTSSPPPSGYKCTAASDRRFYRSHCITSS